MPVTELTPPSRTRESKYLYTADDANSALDMLEADKAPGDGPFDTAGQARGAANALLRAIGNIDGVDADQYGSRVWEDADNGGHFFAIKKGRKEYQGRNTGKGKGK